MARTRQETDMLIAAIAESMAGDMRADIAGEMAGKLTANISGLTAIRPAVELGGASAGDPAADIPGQTASRPAAELDGASAGDPAADIPDQTAIRPVEELDGASAGDPAADIPDQTATRPTAEPNGASAGDPAAARFSAGVARLAVCALLCEVCTTPKPGLVDRANSGSHTDMDIYTFVDSAFALQPYFGTCVRTGLTTARMPAPETFKRLRPAGVQAEREMFAATGGVNTHKGAIFSMGIVCAAVGRLARSAARPDGARADADGAGPASPARTPASILSECAAMTRGVTASDFSGLTPDKAVTTGQRLYLQYGITGIRGQAEAGFPAVLNAGLPVLRNGAARGRSLNDAGCAALLALMCAATDTNLIARSDLATWQEITQKIRELLNAVPYPDLATLTALDREFIARNLSPGGSADLLALCYLLYFLEAAGGHV